MAINNGNAYQNQFGQQYGNQQQMYGMNQQFGTPQYGNQMMNNASRPGLSVVPIDMDEQVTNYPVASGNTVMFVNFNTNRICFKSTNTNGVGMPPQWASFTYDQQPSYQTSNNQNGQQPVSREEFDELKAMMQRTLDAVQNQKFRQRGPHNKQKGGFDSDRPESVPNDDE